MSLIDIYASKSITISDRFPSENVNSGEVFIGNIGKFHYITYLYFDLSSLKSFDTIASAKLVLFKSRGSQLCCGDYCAKNREYGVYVLKDHFSILSNYNNMPQYDTTQEVKFISNPNNIYIEIDVSKVVQLWQDGIFDNKGLMLVGNKWSSIPLIYGSSKSKDNTLKPFLRVYYSKESIVPSHVDLECNYEIISSVNTKDDK